MRMISLLVAASVLLSSPAVMAQGMPGGMGDGGGMGGGMGGGRGGPGGGPGGGKAPRAPKPVKRKDFDKLVTGMFRMADADHDGTVALDELHAVIDARREAVISARFEAVDTDRNGMLSRAEFVVWQKQMGSAASSEGGGFGARDGQIADAIKPETGKDMEDLMLADMIEPLSGTVIARANTNYDAGVSLDELLAYEGKRFDAADKNQDGFLTMDELRPDDRSGKTHGPGGPGGFGPPQGGRPQCPPGDTC
ncbi:EF-hand domain-containing protein [Novosphingobium album (ex Hu et al. 2023)]|uniref:EF-hand domain-containing protein n=1 Tax=Novosphingobium album (ex Hu et al. 2023) TaxID=2930093 RepID=A0ABT0AZX6_9SPHN|nr:EF-hand domain-containing protein [Novosphingobium album (ex Hu et al. 2023)]MCJ2178367.1 EF-hand domain-containing protein [Novosphingobium album (ex Hu et al. 2023)]